MKIIEFIFRLGSGGAETFVANLSRQMAEMGHEVQILTLVKERKGAEDVYGPIINGIVPLKKLDFDEGFSMSKVKAVCDYIKQEKPDVVHCHLNVIPYVFPIAIYKRKIKFFHTLHNVANHIGGNTIQRRIDSFYYSTGRIYPVAISDTCAKSFLDVYKVNNVHTIYNCSAEMKRTTLFERVKKEIEGLKNRHDTPVFLHVARCNPQKRQDRLIEAFNQINKEGLDFLLLIVGRDFDLPSNKHLMEKACKNIHFLGQKGNVADYLFCSDMFCMTSDYEGLPISLLEAFSTGVIPVCTPAGGIVDIIKEGYNGFLSEDFSTESYVDAIKRSLKNKVDRNLLMKLYKDNYSVQTCVSNYITYFALKE